MKISVLLIGFALCVYAIIDTLADNRMATRLDHLEKLRPVAGTNAPSPMRGVKHWTVQFDSTN